MLLLACSTSYCAAWNLLFYYTVKLLEQLVATALAVVHLTTAQTAAFKLLFSTDVVPRRWGLAQRPMTRFLLAAGVHLGGYV